MQMHNITGDVRAKFHLRQNPKEYFPMLEGQIRPSLTLLYYIRFVGLRILRLKNCRMSSQKAVAAMATTKLVALAGVSRSSTAKKHDFVWSEFLQQPI